MLLELASTGQLRPAIDYALGLVADGLAPDRLIVDVLAETLRETGRRWLHNQATLAQAYAVTAVVDGVLGAVGLSTAGPGSLRRGSVLVACVEGEYHTMPARLGVERLRLDGWDVTFLGASVPAHDLQQHVVDAEPDRVVLSCTLPLNLRGAVRCISAVADLGVAVVVAGSAFGGSPDRAARLGASGWLGPATEASTLLEGRLSPARSRPLDRSRSLPLTMQRREVVDTCLAGVVADVPRVSSYSGEELRSIREHLDQLVRHLALAVDLEEPCVFHDFVGWWAELTTSRDLPLQVLVGSLAVVLDFLERKDLVEAAAVCRSVPSLTPAVRP